VLAHREQLKRKKDTILARWMKTVAREVKTT
jgi:hypothetical protein